MSRAESAPDDAAAAASNVVEPIPHEALTREHLPHPRAPFEEVVELAYAFDGYQAFGMRMCGEMANRGLSHFVRLGELPGWLEGDLDRLRACLFFEARRWILLEREPDARGLIYVHALVDAIGATLDARGAGAAPR